MDDRKQQEFSQMAEQLYQLLRDRSIDYNNDRFLKNLKRYLHASGKKVIDSNRKLSEKISRVLSEKNLLERRRAMELVGEIRQMAYTLVDEKIKDDGFIEVEAEPYINLIDRWELDQGKESMLDTLFPDGIGGTDSKEVSLKSLFDQSAIDKKKLTQRIDAMLDGKIQVTLKEIVDFFGLENGLSEVVGYLSIASSSSHHIILEETIDPIIVENRKVNVPMIIYTKSSS
jgi:hypothetical protein